MNSKLFGMLIVVAAAAASAFISSQNALASICPPMCVDILEEEAAQAENATMSNQTADGNMTGTNSTS